MEKQILTFEGGLSTKIQPHLIQNNQAVECYNIDLTRGSIYPFEDWVDITNDFSNPVDGIYAKIFNGSLITNNEANDKRSYATFGSRLYWSNGTYNTSGLMRYNDTPEGTDAAAPDVDTFGTLALANGDGDSLDNTYAYVYTVLDSDGIESIPSDTYTFTATNASIEITVDITNEDLPSDTVAKRRIYRTGGANPTFNLIAELDAGTLVYDDNTLDINVSRIELTTFDNYAPIDGLTHLVENNGTMWASYGDRVYFSENGQPEFWNPLDFVVLIDNCTGIGKLRDVVVAFTTSDVYVISGYNRDNISLEKLPYTEGCLNHWTIANVDRYLMWTSRNGICMFDGSTVSVVTRNVLSWGSGIAIRDVTFDELDIAFNSAAGHEVVYAVGYDGKYYAVSREGIGVIDMNNGAVLASSIGLEGVSSLVYDYNENSINGIVEIKNEAGETTDHTMHAFKVSDEFMTALWTTGKIQDEGYGILKQYRRIELDAVPDNVKVYVNDRLVLDIDKKRKFYLPNSSIGNTIQFEISTSNEIRSLSYEYGKLS